MAGRNVFGMGRDALAELTAQLQEPAYRGQQLYAWLYQKRARCFAEMTNLGKGLRAKLGVAAELRWPQVAERQRSTDGTLKYLFRLDDGATIESVYIPEARR